MSAENELEAAENSDSNPLDATIGDHSLTVARALSAMVLGPAAGLVGELAPSATERQHERAIRALQRVVQKLIDQGTFASWEHVQVGQEYDAAYVRALRAAEEAAAEEKREFIWYGLINGWVRTDGNPTRDRFQRLVGKYDLEHFQILKQMQSMVSESVQWFSFESGDSKVLVRDLNLDRDKLLPYIQEFAADGLVMIYDQPDLKQPASGDIRVQTRKIVLWKRDADRLIEFVSDPNSIVRVEHASND